MPTDKELVSIVIPIYKVERYLRKCIESVMAQTYTNIEIILVEDGSPDNCGAICDEYAKKDKRIRVIHKQNGGLSSARNAGADIAKGKWIGFVDADDYCMPEMYEKLYNAVKRANADMAVCNYAYVDEFGKSADSKGSIPVERQVLAGQEALHKLCESGSTVWVTAFNKLYKTNLLTEIKFPEGKLHEDEFTIHHFFNKCNCVVTIPDFLYHYVQRGDSIMGKPFTIKRLDAFEAFWDRYKFFLAKGEGFEHCAHMSLRSCAGILCMAFTKLSFQKNKDILIPLYQKVLPLLLKKYDLRAVKLFIWRHRWLRFFAIICWDIRNNILFFIKKG